MQVTQHPKFAFEYNRLVDLRTVTHNFTKQTVMDLLPILTNDLDVQAAKHTWLMEDAELIAWARYLQTKSEQELPVRTTVSPSEAAEHLELTTAQIQAYLKHTPPFDIEISV